MVGRWRGDRWIKSSARGAYRDGRGGGGPAMGSVFGAGRAAPPAAGGGRGCLAGGGCRLTGVEVEDELQALDFVSNGCKID